MSEEEDKFFEQMDTAILRSVRHTKYNVTLCVLAGWSHDEIMHWIDTGKQPEGKEHPFLEESK